MNFFIVSIEHTFQSIPLRDQVISEKKEQLRTFVIEIIAGRHIDLVCEESDPSLPSIAQLEAFNYKPRIQWKNINMTSQERLEAGIMEALLYRPYERQSLKGRVITTHHRIPEDDDREEFFKDEIIKAANAIGAKSVLILCGAMHTEPLKMKLEKAGHTVETYVDLAPDGNLK